MSEISLFWSVSTVETYVQHANIVIRLIFQLIFRRNFRQLFFTIVYCVEGECYLVLEILINAAVSQVFRLLANDHIFSKKFGGPSSIFLVGIRHEL